MFLTKEVSLAGITGSTFLCMLRYVCVAVVHVLLFYVADFNYASGLFLFVCLFVVSRGRYLVALGRSWHPEEFTCSQCKVVLEEGGFFEERGSVYCTKCHDNRYAPNCAKCKKKITGVRAVLSPY